MEASSVVDLGVSVSIMQELFESRTECREYC